MKAVLKCLLLLAILLAVAACDDKKSKPTGSQALANYWEGQSELTNSLVNRDATMHSIEQKILDLGRQKSRNAIDDINALVNTYAQQSDASADYFESMRDLEGQIVPYGDDKGLLGDVAKGIYNKASGAVISSGRMVRSGWRVLSGNQSLRQMLRDPESGIPIVSDFATTLQNHNAQRDASIKGSILEENDQDGNIPLASLPGNTPQEKVNAYLNLSEEDPLKMNMRRDVMLWDEDERIRTAATAKKLGETGVKIVGDSYGGPIGEWTNEIVHQHVLPGQSPDDKGSLKIKINSADPASSPITRPKTLIIDRRDTPDNNPRITVIIDAPATLEQELPSGSYNIIAMAQDYIRNVEAAVNVVKDNLTQQVNELLKLADNAIIIEGISAQPEVITLGDNAEVRVSCLSSIGQNLDFTWSITGGSYSNMAKDKNKLSFKPTTEGDFEISCEIKDGLGNMKHASTSISVIDARISLQGFEIYSEDINDSKLNPGESAKYIIDIRNNGDTALSGSIDMAAYGGVQLGFNALNTVMPIGQTAQIAVDIQMPATFSEAQANLELRYLIQGENNSSVLLTLPIAIPVDFYATIEPIVSPVSERVLSISGRVANPLLTRAQLIVDNDAQQAYDVELHDGFFSQQVVINSSAAEEQHSARIIAVSGSLTAEATVNFTSQVPPTALRVTLTWDTGGTDVDLWVTDPNGERCYYGHRSTASGLSLDFDDVDGYGPENITTTNIIPGDYVVQVHYYSDHDYENAIPSNAAVVIRIDEGSPNEVVNNYYGYLDDTGAMWTVTSLTFNGATWKVKANNDFKRLNPNTLPAK